MRHGIRWALVAVLNVLAFAGVFLLFYAAGVPLLPTSDDNRVAVGVAAATVAATVGGAWGAWWVPRAAGTTEPAPPGARLEFPNATVTVAAPQSDPAPLRVRMGDLPREPVGFQPRADLLDELAEATGRHGLTVVHAVTGARGVGKTQLAAAYARRRIEEGWPVVAWITAEDGGQLTSGLAELAAQLGVRAADDDAPAAARAALTWIARNPEPCLLVLDNATDPDEIAGLLPTAGRAQAVVTTTSQAFENLAGARVDVTVFTQEEALDFLSRRTGVPPDDGARDVAEELGRLPLALAQAAYVIRARGTGYRAYLERLRAYPLRTVLEKVPGERYPHGVAEAVLLAAEQVGQRHPVVRLLLDALSVLAPSGVPRDVLRGVAKEAGADDTAEVEAGLGALTQASLVTDAGADAVSVHRLVQRVVRERAGEALRPVVGAVVRHLHEVLVPEEDAWERREFAGQLVDQIGALWAVARGDLASYDQEVQNSLVGLRRWAAYDHLGHVGAMARAVEWAGETRRDCEEALGEEAAAFRLAVRLEGEMYAWSGRTEQAITAYRRLLELSDRCLGPEDEGTLEARRHLARSYQSAARYELSVPMFEELEQDVRRLVGPDHERTRKALDDLAYAYAAAGRRTEAVSLLERLRADWPTGGGASRSRLDSLRSLAETFEEVGRAEEGVALLRRHLQESEAEHGPDAPETVWARNSLALHCADASLHGEGLTAATRAVEDARRVFGPRSPDTFEIQDTLATCLLYAGRHEESMELFGRLVEERTALHGPDDGRVLLARRRLVWSLGRAWRPDEAYAAQVVLIADLERLLGSEAPQTFEERRTHIHVCAEAGRPEEAVAYARGVLADHERVRGPSHPQTFDARTGLADALRDAARYPEAVELLERMVQDAARTFGPGHPRTLSSRGRLARVLLEEGRPDPARELRAENLRENIRAYGDDHINVVWARSDLADALTWCGEHDEALAVHRRVVEDVDRILGADHQAAVLARRWLATAYGEAERHREQLTVTEQVVADSERLYGPDNELTLFARSEHASALTGLGRGREARRLIRETEASARRLLGVEHPYTVYLLGRVADGHRAVQRRFKALRIRHQVVRACEARSGSWSWDATAARRRLGHAYASVGRVRRNAVVQRRLLTDLTDRFGTDHHAVLGQRYWWTHALWLSGRWRTARETARARRADHERLYGPDHPWTLESRWLVAATDRRTGRLHTAVDAYTVLAADRARVHGTDHLLAWYARCGTAYATLWALRPHRAVVLYDTALQDGIRILGRDSRPVERLLPRYALLCLVTGHWLRLRAAVRVLRRRG
ncbi:FxSxx-COOH system tetratricopeptide repeat protein [Streptomyces sp. NPDC004393]